MKRRTLIAAAGTGTVVGLAGCTSVFGSGEDGPCDGQNCDIGMTRNAFVPETVEVSVGDTVVWRNTSGADHTITAYDGAIPDGARYFATGGFESETAAREAWADHRGGTLRPRETYEHTFEVAGTHEYLCLPHERAGMVGEIVVSE